VTKERHFEQVEVDRIFLYEENPRHEPIESEPEIIEHLCKDEQVFSLARSISEAGPNPLELLGLVELGGAGRKKNFQVWEGNRRVCAIKLLNDPDLAPPHLRKDFARLAKTYTPLKKIMAVIFDDHDDIRYWMGINHGGVQGGVGRLSWDADQKERHFGSGRNRVALAVLDAAQDLGLINKEEREGRLTTAQRFLNSSVVKEAIGIDASNKEDVTYNRPLADLKKQLSRFIGDLKHGVKVTSRHNRDQIDAYGRQLARNAGITGERVQPQSLKSVATAETQKTTKRGAASKKRKKKDHLEYSKDLALALEAVGSDKLESLYTSLYSIRLEANTPLLTIGLWAFIETISALAGKDPNNDFLAFFSKDRLSRYGLGDVNKKTGPIRDALDRIQKLGNTTKHHETSASFSGKQLANDLTTITPTLIKTLQGIAAQK
jgi:hypothetical protein